jgi:hypothetical protein
VINSHGITRKTRKKARDSRGSGNDEYFLLNPWLLVFGAQGAPYGSTEFTERKQPVIPAKAGIQSKNKQLCKKQVLHFFTTRFPPEPAPAKAGAGMTSTFVFRVFRVIP